MQQVPLMNVVEELFTLWRIERARQVDQDTWIPETKQGTAAVWEIHVHSQLQQLSEAFQVLRRDQPSK